MFSQKFISFRSDAAFLHIHVYAPTLIKYTDCPRTNIRDATKKNLVYKWNLWGVLGLGEVAAAGAGQGVTSPCARAAAWKIPLTNQV